MWLVVSRAGLGWAGLTRCEAEKARVGCCMLCTQACAVHVTGQEKEGRNIKIGAGLGECVEGLRSTLHVALHRRVEIAIAKLPKHWPKHFAKCKICITQALFRKAPLNSCDLLLLGGNLRVSATRVGGFRVCELRQARSQCSAVQPINEVQYTVAIYRAAALNHGA